MGMLFKVARPIGDAMTNQGGFRDWIKNPEWRRSMERSARKDKPPELSNAEIRTVIEGFLDGTHDRDLKTLLKYQGERVLPGVLQALGDRRTWAWRYRHFVPFEHAGDDCNPLDTLADLIDPFAPTAAVPLLTPYVRHPSPDVRKQAALALGNIGSDESAAGVALALHDRDDYVRGYALMGIQRSLKAGRGTCHFRACMFTQIVPLLTRRYPHAGRLRRWFSEKYHKLRRRLRLPSTSITHGNFSTIETAPDCLLSLDRNKAVLVLSQPPILSASNEDLFRILEALNKHEVPLALPTLQNLLEQLQPHREEYFVACAVEGVLLALATTRTPEAAALIRNAQAWGDERIELAASKALGKLEGVSNPAGYVLERMDKVGLRRLTKAQKLYYCVWLLNAEVRNGGFSQYFVNSSGNLARLTLKALRALKAEHAASTLARAMAVFGVAGPAANRDARHEQLAAVFDAKENDLSDLDHAFYEDRDGLMILLQEFARTHAKHFGAGR